MSTTIYPDPSTTDIEAAIPSSIVYDSAPRPLLLVKLTGYRILTVVLTVAFVAAKAVMAYQGKRAGTTLDWVFAGVVAIGLWWIGLYETVNPPIWPWLFHYDYATPLILLRLYFCTWNILYATTLAVIFRKVYSVAITVVFVSIFVPFCFVLGLIFGNMMYNAERALVARRGHSVERWIYLVNLSMRIGVFISVVLMLVYLFQCGSSPC